MPPTATALSPAHAAHPAIQHLRQLHRQLDDEQLLAIAHEALHPPPTHSCSSSSSTPAAFPPLSVIACPGSGKCFARGTRLRLFNGDLLAVESVVGGERLMGDDGLPRTVTPGTLTRGVATLYEVRPTWLGAEPFTVNGAHILVLVNTRRPWLRERVHADCSAGWEVCWWEVDVASNRMEVRSRASRAKATAQRELERRLASWAPVEWQPTVEEYLSAPGRLRQHCRLLASQPITFTNPQLPRLSDVLSTAMGGVPPTADQVNYMAWWLGVWLTCGSSATARIRQGGAPAPDPHHREEVMHRLVHGFSAAFGDDADRAEDTPSSAGWKVYWVAYEGTVCDRVLRYYGLLNNKHLPRALICDTLHVRQRLLAGLLDGAGHFAADSDTYEIACQHRHLLVAYKELAATLGLRNGRVYEHGRHFNQQTGDQERYIDAATGEARWHTSYRVSLSGDMWDVAPHCAPAHTR